MKRYLEPYIVQDLPKKVVILTGPRQCGKTTLAKQLYVNFDYFNYDASEDRLALKEKSWDRNKKLVIFDELHKMRDWKRWIKGIYDTENIPPQLLVTGSAKLNTYRKVGDSLAGRYFQFHLHPLDLKEINQLWDQSNDEVFDRFWHCSGFPEPFLEGSQTFYNRWQRSHLDIILRQDLIDIHTVRDVKQIELLVHLLKNSVGSNISYANLARNLERDANTVKRWIQILEDLYIIYRITPYHKKITRSLLKEPKFYFYNHALVEHSEGARLENIVANALLKELQFIEDTTGTKAALQYLRTKDGNELDFLICIDNQVTHVIEVKRGNKDIAKGFKHFKKFFPNIKMIQLVKELTREKTYPDNLEIRNLVKWLTNFQLI